MQTARSTAAVHRDWPARAQLEDPTKGRASSSLGARMERRPRDGPAEAASSASSAVNGGHGPEKRKQQQQQSRKGDGNGATHPPAPAPPPPPPSYPLIPEGWKPTKDVRARLPRPLRRWTGYRDPDSKPPYRALPVPPFTWLARLPLQYETWILSTGTFLMIVPVAASTYHSCAPRCCIRLHAGR